MKLTSESIADKVKDYIKEQYFDGPDEELTNDLALLSSGIIDSISTLLVVEFLEKAFDFEFQPHEVTADNLDSIDKIVAFVQIKTA